MRKIGILSDTHAHWDEKYLHYFEPCDEIWHAGDIGSIEVAQKLAEFRPDPSIRATIFRNPPQLFISGHSHILKVKFDKTLNLLHINPGAAGLYGWHKERTLIRLTIEGNKFTDCEVITLENRQ